MLLLRPPKSCLGRLLFLHQDRRVALLLVKSVGCVGSGTVAKSRMGNHEFRPVKHNAVRCCLSLSLDK